jgi:hypothetical protein
MKNQHTRNQPNSPPYATERLSEGERQVVERIRQNARPSRNQSFTRWLLSVHCGWGGW